MSDLPPNVIHATKDNFSQAVVEESAQRCVLVDLWAPWCGPCRQLTPLLERMAAEYDGKFLLAKVNVDEEQELAAAFGAQSIPMVVAILNGQAVDQFTGMIQEDELREWLNRLLPSPAQELIAQAAEVEQSDPAAAAEKYQAALELAPDDPTAKIALARTLLALNREGESATIIAELETRGFLEPEAERIKSQLALRRAAAESGGLEAAQQKVAENPDDLSAQIHLADALAVAGRHEEALQLCLELIRNDRSGAGSQAKDTMLKIFDMLGPESPLTSQYRRQLATLLY